MLLLIYQQQCTLLQELRSQAFCQCSHGQTHAPTVFCATVDYTDCNIDLCIARDGPKHLLTILIAAFHRIVVVSHLGHENSRIVNRLTRRWP